MPATYPVEPSTIGEHIRKKRMELKLSQSDVAELFKVSTDCITFWENNRSSPQVRYAPRVIGFLGYSPWTFDESTLEGLIRAYRYRNGLSSKDLGRLIGVDGSTVIAWETGTSLPASKSLKKLTSLLQEIKR